METTKQDDYFHLKFYYDMQAVSYVGSGPT